MVPKTDLTLRPGPESVLGRPGDPSEGSFWMDVGIALGSFWDQTSDKGRCDAIDADTPSYYNAFHALL